MPKQQWNLLKHHSLLAIIRAGFPSRKLTREQASETLDNLIRDGSDEDFKIIADRVAHNEMLQGKSYNAEYATHLRYLENERERLRSKTTA